MQKADVYVNGKKIMTHEGGYIPFVIDLTDKVNYGAENTIAVKIDSRHNRNFAPGKDKPDFQYFGGIYEKNTFCSKCSIYVLLGK